MELWTIIGLVFVGVMLWNGLLRQHEAARELAGQERRDAINAQAERTVAEYSAARSRHEEQHVKLATAYLKPDETERLAVEWAVNRRGIFTFRSGVQSRPLSLSAYHASKAGTAERSAAVEGFDAGVSFRRR
jgi:hypothetical protein